MDGSLADDAGRHGLDVLALQRVNDSIEDTQPVERVVVTSSLDSQDIEQMQFQKRLMLSLNPPACPASL